MSPKGDLENILKGKFKETEGIVKEALDQGKDPNEIIQAGLSKGMAEVGRGFKNDEYFFPEVHGRRQGHEHGPVHIKALFHGPKRADHRNLSYRNCRGRLVRHRQKPGLHDHGGIWLYGLRSGSRRETRIFIREIRDKSPELVGLSALLATTMPMQNETIKAIEQDGLRGNTKILVGGAPVD